MSSVAETVFTIPPRSALCANRCCRITVKIAWEEKKLPVSSTAPILSASPSRASPATAPCIRTVSPSSCKCSPIGSGGCPPKLGLWSVCISWQPKSRLKNPLPAPNIGSATTCNPAWRIRGISTILPSCWIYGVDASKCWMLPSVSASWKGRLSTGRCCS